MQYAGPSWAMLPCLGTLGRRFSMQVIAQPREGHVLTSSYQSLPQACRSPPSPPYLLTLLRTVRSMYVLYVNPWLVGKVWYVRRTDLPHPYITFPSLPGCLIAYLPNLSARRSSSLRTAAACFSSLTLQSD